MLTYLIFIFALPSQANMLYLDDFTFSKQLQVLDLNPSSTNSTTIDPILLKLNVVKKRNETGADQHVSEAVTESDGMGLHNEITSQANISNNSKKLSRIKREELANGSEESENVAEVQSEQDKEEPELNHPEEVHGMESIIESSSTQLVTLAGEEMERPTIQPIEQAPPSYSPPIPPPTSDPSPMVTPIPVSEPYPKPTSRPPIEPTFKPPIQPTYEPPVQPTYKPPFEPTFKPPVQPTYEPPFQPSYEPPVLPTYEPPVKPTYKPPVQPTYKPPVQPTYKPPVEPTYKPPIQPTYKPPVQPTYKPPVQPTYKPPVQPTYKPPVQPTYKPPIQPTYKPPVQPTYRPPVKPTTKPIVAEPGVASVDENDFGEMEYEEAEVEDEAEYEIVAILGGESMEELDGKDNSTVSPGTITDEPIYDFQLEWEFEFIITEEDIFSFIESLQNMFWAVGDYLISLIMRDFKNGLQTSRMKDKIRMKVEQLAKNYRISNSEVRKLLANRIYKVFDRSYEIELLRLMQKLHDDVKL